MMSVQELIGIESRARFAYSQPMANSWVTDLCRTVLAHQAGERSGRTDPYDHRSPTGPRVETLLGQDPGLLYKSKADRPLPWSFFAAGL